MRGVGGSRSEGQCLAAGSRCPDAEQSPPYSALRHRETLLKSQHKMFLKVAWITEHAWRPPEDVCLWSRFIRERRHQDWLVLGIYKRTTKRKKKIEEKWEQALQPKKNKTKTQRNIIIITKQTKKKEHSNKTKIKNQLVQRNESEMIDFLVFCVIDVFHSRTFWSYVLVVQCSAMNCNARQCNAILSVVFIANWTRTVSVAVFIVIL